MKYCLWLFGKKVYTLDDVMNSFDTDSLSAYLLGGSLGRWLRSIGENIIADKTDKIDLGGKLDSQLKICFGIERPQEEKSDILADNAAYINGAGYPVPSFATEYHPFGNDEHENAAEGAANSASAANAIGRAGSFVNSLSSFYGSFSGLIGSFAKRNGSFSGALGSYALGGSYASLLAGSAYGIFGSYRFGSALSGRFSSDNVTSLGGFVIAPNGAVLTEKEYEKTMINLSSCPLNSRGYGIHIINAKDSKKSDK